MWLKLKICFGYAILVLLLAFIVYQFRKEQVLRHMLRKEEKELAAIHSLAEKSYIGTFIKYYKISQLIHTQSIAN